MEEEKLNKSRLAFLLVVYFIILAWMVIYKFNVNEDLYAEWNGSNFEIELIPFLRTVEVFQEHDIVEKLIFFVNFIIFIPMGILLPFFMKKKKSLWTIFFVALSIEIFQLIIGWGGYDTTDVIMCFLEIDMDLNISSIKLKRTDISDCHTLKIFS